MLLPSYSFTIDINSIIEQKCNKFYRRRHWTFLNILHGGYTLILLTTFKTQQLFPTHYKILNNLPSDADIFIQTHINNNTHVSNMVTFTIFFFCFSFFTIWNWKLLLKTIYFLVQRYIMYTRAMDNNNCSKIA